MRTMCVLVVGLERENGEELKGQKKRQYSVFLDRDFGSWSGEDEVITITAAEP